MVKKFINLGEEIFPYFLWGNNFGKKENISY